MPLGRAPAARKCQKEKASAAAPRTPSVKLEWFGSERSAEHAALNLALTIFQIVTITGGAQVSVFAFFNADGAQGADKMSDLLQHRETSFVRPPDAEYSRLHGARPMMIRRVWLPRNAWQGWFCLRRARSCVFKKFIKYQMHRVRFALSAYLCASYAASEIQKPDLRKDSFS